MSKRVRKPSALALEAQQSAREQEDEPDEPDEPEARGRRGKKRAVSEEDEESASEKKPAKKKRRKGGGAPQRAEAPMVPLPPLTDLFEEQDELPTFMRQLRKEAPVYENIAGARIIGGLDATDKREFLQAVGQLVCYASTNTRGNLGEALVVDHLKCAAAPPSAAARAPAPPKDPSLPVVRDRRRKYPASDGYTIKWLNEHGESFKDHDAEIWKGRKRFKDVESKFSQVFYNVVKPRVRKSGERAGESVNGYTTAAYTPIFSENEIERVEACEES